jgi:hypothetical protein
MLSLFKMPSTSSFRNASSSNDVKATRYNPNDEEQRAYIEEQLGLFKRRLNNLRAIDKKLGIGLGVDTLLLCGGVVGPALSILSLVGLYLFATQYAMRQEHSDLFQKQLKEIMSTYRWLAKDTARITQDATFLKVLEALVPFVETEDLLLWNLKQTNPLDISDRFTEILSKSPHRIQFVMVTSGSHPMNDSKRAIKINKWAALFEQPLSELERAAYGQPDTEANRTLQLNH